MARVLRNFRYRNLEEPVFPENVRYLSLLDSIIALDDEFYKFPESGVPSLQTLCIKWLIRRSGVLFQPYEGYTTEQLARALPPGPFDALPPPLCDLVCDLMLSLREPESGSAPLYCVVSPYARCLRLREPLTVVAGGALEELLVTRVRHLAELTWTGPPVSPRLLDYLLQLPALTALITDEQLAPDSVTRLLQRCPALRVLHLRDAGCVSALAERGAVGRQLVDLGLLVGDDVTVDLAEVYAVFPALEKLRVRPTRDEFHWCVKRLKSGLIESESWFDCLREVTLVGCVDCALLLRPLKALARLSLERCGYFLSDVALQPRLNFLTSVHCNVHLRRSEEDPEPVVNIETLHVDTVSELLNASVPLSGRTFPRVRRLALAGDVRAASARLDFPELRELHFSYESSVIAEQVLAAAPLAQLERLSLHYQTDDGAPLALGALARCSRLQQLELEGFSEVSVPPGLQLAAVHRLRLRGGTCCPRVVQWLLAALPALQYLQLVELIIRSHVWTRWFRDWRRAGIEVDLVGGCSIPSWRRSSIRSHAGVL